MVRVRGLVTPGTSLRILADNQSWLGRTGLAAQIARYDEAAMLVDPEAMLSNVQRVLRQGEALRVPTALVVQPDMLPFFDRYAGLMARSGVLRVALTSFAQAEAWARAEAAVFEQARRAEEAALRSAPA